MFKREENTKQQSLRRTQYPPCNFTIRKAQEHPAQARKKRKRARNLGHAHHRAYRYRSCYFAKNNFCLPSEKKEVNEPEDAHFHV
ncbi:hypothetical protein POVCU1_056440 [Plasmodium ovale curtisi]|uniref:Uncharacterized protein n=1 Tax=Plasmodium ovale curtisi TaxID=864141 RepID=A0A1A8X857_PLAOA|nr:hypothetical protein POVCU1_056440 [Plasmodium ovale curtisi]